MVTQKPYHGYMEHTPVEPTATVQFPSELFWDRASERAYYDKRAIEIVEQMLTPAAPETAQRKEEPGFRADSGKNRYDLIPFDALDEIVKVFTFGSQKYGDRNWEKGMSWSRAFGSCMRHLTKWWSGQNIDPESGLSHLAHAGANILFLLAWQTRSMNNFDDRSIVKKDGQ